MLSSCTVKSIPRLTGAHISITQPFLDFVAPKQATNAMRDLIHFTLLFLGAEIADSQAVEGSHALSKGYVSRRGRRMDNTTVS